MNYLKSIVRSRQDDDVDSGAETVERLVERLQSSTTFEDRKDALRALKSLSKRYRLDVGAQAIPVLLNNLNNDPANADTTNLILETFNNVVNGDVEEDNEFSEAENHDLGERFTETIIKDKGNVALLLTLIENYEFNIRLPAVRLLTSLLRYRCKDLQEILLSTPGSIPKLTDLLQEQREVIRNDAVLLLFELIRGNSNIQKTVAFQNVFDGLLDVVYQEGDSIIAEDCLYVVLHLLKNNSSNQHLFRENSLIQKLVSILSLLAKGYCPNDDTSAEEQRDVSWSAQRVSNVLLVFQIIRSLVSPANQLNVISGCQKIINQCGMLQDLCEILMSGGVPADVLTEAINTVAEVIRGSSPNQEYFNTVVAPSDPSQPALLVLLLSMVSEKQPFSLRCAVLYCVQCFLYKNEPGKQGIIGTLLPSVADNKSVTAGHVLCTGLVSSDPLVVWYSCCTFLHCLIDVPKGEKERLLNVQLAPSLGHTPVSLMQQTVSVLLQSQEFLTKVGILMFLSAWLAQCPPVIAHLLQQATLIPYLTAQAGASEGDDTERLLQSLCSFILGICIHFNDNTVEKYNKKALRQVLEKRIGIEILVEKLESLTKSEQYARAAQRPQIKAKSPQDVAFDYEFCRFYRSLEQELAQALRKTVHSSHVASEFAQKGFLNGSAVPIDDNNSEQHYEIIDQYKAIIKRQDEELSALKKKLDDEQCSKNSARNCSADVDALQSQLNEKCRIIDRKDEELKNLQSSNTKAEELKAEVERLLADSQQKTAEADYYKQQAQLWQSQLSTEFTSRDPSCLIAQLEYQNREQETQLTYGWQAYEQQVGQISALTAENQKLNDVVAENSALLSKFQQENETLKRENADFRQNTVSKANFESVKTENERLAADLANVSEAYSRTFGDLDSVRKEHEDLLILLADQDVKLREYKRKLRAYGEADLSADEYEDDEYKIMESKQATMAATSNLKNYSINPKNDSDQNANGYY